jgi:hypothetical protein
MEQEQKGEKRADLEKLTTTKLRELALEKYPQITGVHGMKKEALIEAIKAAEVELGVREKEEEKKGSHPEVKHRAKKREKKIWAIPEAKTMVKGLKGEREGALTSKDTRKLERVRSRIKKLKRIMRKLKEAS